MICSRGQDAYITGIAVVIWIRTGCRGGTPGWGRSPHTPFDPNVLSNLVTAINSYMVLYGSRLKSHRLSQSLCLDYFLNSGNQAMISKSLICRIALHEDLCVLLR